MIFKQLSDEPGKLYAQRRNVCHLDRHRFPDPVLRSQLKIKLGHMRLSRGRCQIQAVNDLYARRGFLFPSTVLTWIEIKKVGLLLEADYYGSSPIDGQQALVTES